MLSVLHLEQDYQGCIPLLLWHLSYSLHLHYLCQYISDSPPCYNSIFPLLPCHSGVHSVLSPPPLPTILHSTSYPLHSQCFSHLHTQGCILLSLHRYAGSVSWLRQATSSPLLFNTASPPAFKTGPNGVYVLCFSSCLSSCASKGFPDLLCSILFICSRMDTTTKAFTINFSATKVYQYNRHTCTAQ